MITAMGFDYGSKRIGVAVGQTLTSTASPLAIITVKNQQVDWAQLNALIQEWQPQTLVVGLPKHADGTDNAISEAVYRFCRQLQKRYQLPVQTIDERLSSVAAAELIKRVKSKGQRTRSKETRNKEQRATEQPARNKTNHDSSRSPSSFLLSTSLDAVSAKIILETWLTECL
jgi:putative Holliday junction resolvase